MPNYYFHLHECGSRMMDDEGSEHVDLTSAEAFAVRSAREIMCEELRSGHLCLSCHIDIVDDDGLRLRRVKFAEAVQLVEAPST